MLELFMLWVDLSFAFYFYPASCHDISQSSKCFIEKLKSMSFIFHKGKIRLILFIDFLPNILYLTILFIKYK